MDTNETKDVILMTEETIISQCKKNQGYTTPELNQKLYLHHLGFTKISCLNAFYQCTVLYLNNNAIDNLEGLQPLQNLHTLYVSNNAIQNCLSLPELTKLRVLDISYNSISSFEGLMKVSGLETLLASRNRIENLNGLETHYQLINIDVSWNSIKEADNILPLLFQKTTLRTCILNDNRFIKSIPSYRKIIIANMPSLRFLDRYPIFPEERNCAEAYNIGGTEAEEAQRNENIRQELEEERKQFLFFSESRASVREWKYINGPITESTRYFNDNECDGIFIPNH